MKPKILVVFCTLILFLFIYPTSYSVATENNTEYLILEQVSQINTGEGTFYVEIKENIAYVSDLTYRGLKVINVSNPSEPEIISQYRDNNSYEIPHIFYIQGDILYLGDHTDGLEIYNISDPLHLQKIGDWWIEGVTDDVIVVDDIAYTVSWDEGLRIVNVSDFSNPSLIATYVNENYTYPRVHLIKDYIYIYEIGLTGSKMKIINVSNPNTPTSVGEYMCEALAIKVIDDIAYIAAGVQGFITLNISDPLNPIELGHYEPGGIIGGVDIEEDLAFITDGDQKRLMVLNISDPTKPTILQQCGNFNIAFDVCVSDNYAYVADFEGGLRIIQIWGDQQNDNHADNPIVIGYNNALGILFLTLITCGIIIILFTKNILKVYK